MSKKKEKTYQRSAAPTPSKEADLMITPLLKSKGITLGSKQVKKTDADYRHFLGGYDRLDLGQKELATFLADQLAKSKSSGRFKGLNLVKSQKYDTSGNPMEAYDFGAKKITLHPHGKENPIVKFIHEGTHALDDSPMKIYQKDAIDFLSKILKRNPIDRDQGEWYTGAQNILPVAAQDFRERYPYLPGVRQNIQDSFYNLKVPQVGKKQDIMSFQQAKEELDRQQEPEDDSDLLFTSLSEFPAYGVENLFSPWRVTSQTNPHAKGFLHSIMQGVHRGFSDLGLNEQNYPLVTKAFGDRMAQLGASSVPLSLPRSSNLLGSKSPYSKSIPYRPFPESVQPSISPLEMLYQEKMKKQHNNGSFSFISFSPSSLLTPSKSPLPTLVIPGGKKQGLQLPGEINFKKRRVESQRPSEGDSGFSLSTAILPIPLSRSPLTSAISPIDYIPPPPRLPVHPEWDFSKFDPEMYDIPETQQEFNKRMKLD